MLAINEREWRLTAAFEVIMEHPLKTLLYELFVQPVLRVLTWPGTLFAKVAPIDNLEHEAEPVPTAHQTPAPVIVTKADK